jgi:hypothetical protein
MSRTRASDEPDDDDSGEYEYESDAETEYDPDDPETYPDGVYVDGDERPVAPCPYCRAEIDAESEQCPKCGTFVSAEDAPSEPKSSAWVVLLVLALLAAVYLAVTR